MRLHNIINELDSDSALKSDIRDMIFVAKGRNFLSLDFNKLIKNLTDMNHSIDDEYLRTILKEITYRHRIQSQNHFLLHSS